MRNKPEGDFRYESESQTTPIFALNEVRIFLKEQIRILVEEIINTLLIEAFTAFPGYEAYDKSGYNTDKSRNGYYNRTIDSSVGDLHNNPP